MFLEAEKEGLVEIGLNRTKSYEWWAKNTLLGGILARMIRMIPGLGSILEPVTEKIYRKRVLKKARLSPKAFEDLYSTRGIYLVHRKKKSIVENPASWEEFIKKVLNRKR